MKTDRGRLLVQERIEMNKKAFTLIELLVVIAIIALLLSIIMPSLSLAKEKTRKIMCTNHLRQMGLGLSMYANDHNDRFPIFTDDRVSIWLWNLTKHAGDFVQDYTGAEKDFFYCPSAKFYRQNPEVLEEDWDFADNPAHPYRVTGYYWLLKRPDGYCRPFDNNENKTGSKEYVDRQTMENPSQRELVLDAANSETKSGRENFEYIDSIAVSGKLHPTGHYNSSRGEPDGSNIIFVDQHVDWRDFEMMEKRIQAGKDTLWF